jgi:hypothetical protein
MIINACRPFSWIDHFPRTTAIPPEDARQIEENMAWRHHWAECNALKVTPRSDTKPGSILLARRGSFTNQGHNRRNSLDSPECHHDGGSRAGGLETLRLL